MRDEKNHMPLIFGTAGVPHASIVRSTIEGIKTIRRLGLDAMEVQFVRGVKMGDDTAVEAGKISEYLNVVLSVHAPYYINLNAEGQKKDESIERIVNSARTGSLMKAENIVFHPGFYLKYSKEKTYERIKKSLQLALNRIEEMNLDVMLRPESTGKPKQFGELDELLKLCYELNIMPCIDFSHIHARYGRYNSYSEFCEIIEKVSSIGDEAIKNMHIHISGIDYSLKGEKSHLNLENSDFNYRELLMALKDLKTNGIVICESPNLEEDAILLKNEYKNL